MSALQEKSSRLFERFAEKLGQVDLSVAAAVPAAIGVITVFSGLALEMHGQTNLLQHGGIAGLATYNASLAAEHFSTIGEWLQGGVEGKLLSFGGNMQARGFAAMTVAPLLSVATVSLARGFHGIKAALNDKIQKIRDIARTREPAIREPEPDGRFVWAREREQAPVDSGSWRDSSRPPVEPASRVGAIEMIRRVALSHRINVNDLVIEGNEVRQTNMPSGDRPICKMGSVYWTALEQETLTLHRFAHKHQLDANALYVRDGDVYEENREAFVDRMVCNVASKEWNEVRLEMAAQAMRNVFGDDRTPPVAPARLPDNDDIACALAILGEDATVTRIDQIRIEMSALRTAKPDQSHVDLITEVDAARKAADQPKALHRPLKPGASRDLGMSAGDESLSSSL
jgi:hypothetical protein